MNVTQTVKLKHIIIILLVIFGIVISGLVAYIIKTQTLDPRGKAAGGTVKVYVEPSSLSPDSAGRINGKVMFDSGDKKVFGATIVLKYDPNVLEFADTVTDCNTLTDDFGFDVDSSRGLVNFTRTANYSAADSTLPSGAFCFSSFHFNIKNASAGTTQISFDPAPGNKDWSIIGPQNDDNYDAEFPTGQAINVTLSGSAVTNTPTTAPATSTPTKAVATATPTVKAATSTPTPKPTNTTSNPTTAPTKPANSSIVLTVQEGKVFNTNKPTLTGKAPANSTVEVTVYSKEQTGRVKADASGNWAFTVPQALEPGEHTYYARLVNPDGTLGDLVGPVTFTVSTELPDTFYNPANTAVLITAGIVLIGLSSVIYRRRYKN